MFGHNTLLVQNNDRLQVLMTRQLQFLTHTAGPSVHTSINALTDVQLTWEEQWVARIKNYTEMFRRVRKIAKSYYQLHRVSPSVRMGQLSSHGTNFDGISYLFFENLARKFRFHYNLRRIKGYFTWRTTRGDPKITRIFFFKSYISLGIFKM